MYQDKLAFLKKQLKQLEEGTLPEYQKRNKKIDQQYRERLKLTEVFKEYEVKGTPLNPVPHVPILDSCNSAENKDMTSKILTNGDTVF